jgi:hypothetical protein
MGKLTIILALLATLAFGAEIKAPEPKRAAPKDKEPAYRPLIMPEKPAETAVPAPKQEIPADKTDKSPAVESESGARPSGLFLLQDAEDKQKKQELWIYTQPQEEAALAEQRKEEDRRIAGMERGDRQLPSWAVDPQYRKYTEGTEPEKGYWKTDFTVSQPRSSENEFVPEKLDAQPTPSATLDRPLFPEGTSLNTGREAAKPEPGFLAPSTVQSEKSAEKGAADYGNLYQSNKKEKQVEDFYSGVNKPTKTEREADRHHKPQKPM